MRQRSSDPKLFKAQVVQECLQPGVSISSVAIRHGTNANVISKWLPLSRDLAAATSLPALVPPRAAPKQPAEAFVIIEPRRSINVKRILLPLQLGTAPNRIRNVL